MKKLLTVVLLAFAMQAYAQSNPITGINISLPANPDANRNNVALLTEADIPKPITFKWTPLVPRPTEPVTYRLKVWQLMQGQNGTQAMRVNQPVITKDVDNITQAIVSGILTGPCKPPYLCEFVWNVQALNREGKPIGTNNGTSEAATFKYAVATTTPANAIRTNKPFFEKDSIKGIKKAASKIN